MEQDKQDSCSLATLVHIENNQVCMTSCSSD